MFILFVVPVLTSAAILIPEFPTTTTTTARPVVFLSSTVNYLTTPYSEIASVTVPSRTFNTQNDKIEQKLPFLKGTDDFNRQEFFAIITNDKLSKAEIWERVEKWAEQQSVSVQADVLDFHQRLSSHVENSKNRVQRIVKNLPDALKKLSEIIQDIDITRLQEKNRIANLYTSLDQDVSKTLQWIVHLVSYEQNEGKDLERRSRLRKLKKGGVWTGSVQATNII